MAVQNLHKTENADKVLNEWYSCQTAVSKPSAIQRLTSVCRDAVVTPPSGRQAPPRLYGSTVSQNLSYLTLPYGCLFV
jgi:hypothetical protein